jgi:hypothetical protein
VSGGDFLSRSEAQLCNRRRIEDRIEVVRDLQRVVKHLGPIAAADQLGLASGDLERIEGRKLAISPALLAAMYGAGAARLLPSLAPRDALDAGVAKIVAACSARAPVAPVARSMPFDMAKSAKPPAGTPTMGPRDLDAHERQVLAEVGTNRAALVAILRRVHAAAGDWRAAGTELGLGKSTVMNLAGGHSKFSFRTAQLLLTWDKENPVTGADAGAAAAAVAVVADAAVADAGSAVADGGAVEGPLPEPIEQNSTPAPLAETLPPGDSADDSRAGVEGAAVSPPLTPPPTFPTPANDDPFAVALTALVTARDAAQAARIAIRTELVGIEAQIVPLQERRVQLIADEAALLGKLAALCVSVDSLQATAK